MLVRHAPLAAIRAAADAAGFQLVALRPGPRFAPDGHRFVLRAAAGTAGYMSRDDRYDVFFERLFEAAPRAYVRTAQAVFDGRDNYRRLRPGRRGPDV